MDLATIRKKLDNGAYSDPWEYVDDVWLMFDNAWLYNRKTSRVYRYCTKVGEKGQYLKLKCLQILLGSEYLQLIQFDFSISSCLKYLKLKSTP